MTGQPDLFAAPLPPPAKLERDKALYIVADNSESWIDKACRAMRFLSVRRDWTGEDIRLTLETVVGAPHHHNAWGALIKRAINEGLIHYTGKHVHMRTLKSHARQTPVYRATGSGLVPGTNYETKGVRA